MNLEDLMQEYRDGDQVAFAELYSRVAPRIRAYLRSLIRDSAAADDLLQQTFAKLHVARHGYVQGADPVPWLYAIAHRACIDELRRRRRARVRLGRPGEILPDLEASLSGTAVGAEEAEAFGAEDRERVVAALDCLPEDQRTAVVLTKLHGKSVAEAANILGTTVGAVKLRAHRAYGRLRDRLREQDAASGQTEARGASAFAA